MLQYFFFSVLLFICSFSFAQQVADTSFRFPIKDPAYKKGKGSVITLDEAHYNFHTLSGRYYSFGKLLEQDGYRMQSGAKSFTTSYLNGLDILVIANALPDTGEWILPTNSAFTDEEVDVLENWVASGGSLFLIADHMPFPGSVEKIGLAFGFNFINGFAMRKDDKPEVFSIQKKNLYANAITAGRNTDDKIDSIRLFTGQGFIAPSNATIISSLDDDYEILLPIVAWEFDDATPRMSGAGLVSGAYLEYGKGKIVVMGEAAMFSAQLAGPSQQKMGMNHPGAAQNPQFLLNIIHWLDGLLN